MFIEYSNEVWNTLFDQGKWAMSEGLRLGLSADKYIAQYRYYAKRSNEIFELATAVLSNNTINSKSFKIVRVLSTFTASTYATNIIISYLNQIGGKADTLGITAYFDCKQAGSGANAPFTAQKSIQDILAMCTSDIFNQVTDLLRIVKIAKNFNMTIQTYEGI